MPIRFRCDRCGQLLGIARRKAGTEVECPRCARELVVPRSDQLELPLNRSPAALYTGSAFELPPARTKQSRPAPAPAQSKPIEILTPSPDLLEAPSLAGPVSSPTAATESPGSREGLDVSNGAPTLSPPSKADPPRARLTPSPSATPPLKRLEADSDAGAAGSDHPTWELYPGETPTPPRDRGTRASLEARPPWQLVMGLCLASAGLGFLIGFLARSTPSTSSRGEAKEVLPPAPVAGGAVAAAVALEQVPDAKAPLPGFSIQGRVRYKEGESIRFDEGASVLALPCDLKPPIKFSAQGLRPAERHLQYRPGLEALTKGGGYFATLDAQGRFDLSVNHAGKYYLLVLSHRAKRAEQHPIFPDDRSILRLYFEDVDDLVGPREYLLVVRQVKEGHAAPLDHTFQ